MKELVGNEHRYKDDVRFSYDNLSRKVTVYLKNNADVMLNDMAYMLGFSPKQIILKTTTGDKQVDLEYGFHDLFVNCDLIQSHHVGDALVPLLGIVPLEGEVNQRVSKSFVRPQYVPVEQKAIWNHRSQHKARHRGICAIWVCKSVVNASFSSISTSVLLKMKNLHAPEANWFLFLALSFLYLPGQLAHVYHVREGRARGLRQQTSHI